MHSRQIKKDGISTIQVLYIMIWLTTIKVIIRACVMDLSFCHSALSGWCIKRCTLYTYILVLSLLSSSVFVQSL